MSCTTPRWKCCLLISANTSEQPLPLPRSPLNKGTTPQVLYTIQHYQIHRVWQNHGWFYEAGGILGIFGVRPEENRPVPHMKWRIFLDHSINLFNQTHH